METVAAIAQVTEVALRISSCIAKFCHDAKDSNEARSDLYSQIDTLDDTLSSIQHALGMRREQVQKRPISEEEENICKRMKVILELCEQSLDRFASKIRKLGPCAEDAKWWSRAWIQFNMQTRAPAIARIEGQISANVSALQTLLVCFQPFMHAELQDGIDTSNQYLDKILKRIDGLEELDRHLLQLVQSSTQSPPTKRAIMSNPMIGFASGLGADNAPIEDEWGPQAEARELVKATISFARTVCGTISEIGSVAPFQSGEHGQFEDSEILSADGRLPSDIIAPIESRRPAKDSSGSDKDGESEYECVRVGILTSHIDNYKQFATTAMQEERFADAEKSLSNAVAIGKQREERYKFPFEEEFELRERLAFARWQNGNYSGAEDEYKSLLRQLSIERTAADPDSSNAKGRLYYSLAKLYRQKYMQAMKPQGLVDESFFAEYECWGEKAYSFAAKQGSSPDKDGPPWPHGNPTLQETADLMIDLYNAWDKPGHAMTFQQRKGSNVSPIQISSPNFGPGLPAGFVDVQSTQSTTSSNPLDDIRSSIGSPTSASSNPPPPPSPSVSSKPGADLQPVPSDSGISITSQSSVQLTVPISEGDHVTTKYLLESWSESVNMEEIDKKTGLTPLLLACSRNDVKIVRLLMNQSTVKPDISARDDNGWTALHHAVQAYGNRGSECELIELLLKAGADVNARATIAPDSKSKSAPTSAITPLHLAARKRNPEAAKCLLNHKANINACDSSGRTSLWWAVDHKRLALCEMLLDRHAEYDRSSMTKRLPKLEVVFRKLDSAGALNVRERTLSDASMPMLESKASVMSRVSSSSVWSSLRKVSSRK
ncbi:hypothetical protein BCR34DRAFT_601668 [Clohesyomyces aquaticus]|uniref:Uncharacterized protein n=1 Tax=Clohesyomyces aquaticus TaxID=1231657 RepID=A0A1Y1ZM36_9PLEO|nr:hypothetical protein BCR34DRAFT_601668 [Clohesyomyces aquaticus]